MEYLVPEDVAEENGIVIERFVKFLEVHLKQVAAKGSLIAEDTLRMRIEKNFGNVNEDVYNVTVQELQLSLER